MAEPVDLGVEESCEASSELVVHPTASNSAVTQRALRAYVEGLAAGKTVDEAAAAAGTSVKEIKRGGRRVREKLEALAGDWTADAEQLRRLVTLTWTEMAVDAIDPKQRMAALHELSQIPEVGLKPTKGGLAQRPELSAETLALLEEE